jgi:hypothetical protein
MCVFQAPLSVLMETLLTSLLFSLICLFMSGVTYGSLFVVWLNWHVMYQAPEARA